MIKTPIYQNTMVSITAVRRTNITCDRNNYYSNTSIKTFPKPNRTKVMPLPPSSPIFASLLWLSG